MFVRSPEHPDNMCWLRIMGAWLILWFTANFHLFFVWFFLITVMFGLHFKVAKGLSQRLQVWFHWYMQTSTMPCNNSVHHDRGCDVILTLNKTPFWGLFMTLLSWTSCFVSYCCFCDWANKVFYFCRKGIINDISVCILSNKLLFKK